MMSLWLHFDGKIWGPWQNFTDWETAVTIIVGGLIVLWSHYHLVKPRKSTSLLQHCPHKNANNISSKKKKTNVFVISSIVKYLTKSNLMEDGLTWSGHLRWYSPPWRGRCGIRRHQGCVAKSSHFISWWSLKQRVNRKWGWVVKP